jgi:hypothetical protein
MNSVQNYRETNPSLEIESGSETYSHGNVFLSVLFHLDY